MDPTPPETEIRQPQSRRYLGRTLRPLGRGIQWALTEANGIRPISGKRRSAFWILFVVVFVVVVVSFVTYPLFWMVAVIPGATILLFQRIALSQWQHRRHFFNATDYVYYLLIGGAVVIGSQYVRGREDVSYLGTFLEKAALQARLATIEVHIRDLRVDQERRRVLAVECVRGDAPLTTPGVLACVGAFAGNLWYRFVLPSQARERERIRAQLDKIDQTDAPGGERKIRDLTILFMWAPTLVLVGISMKLGKTTTNLLT